MTLIESHLSLSYFSPNKDDPVQSRVVMSQFVNSDIGTLYVHTLNALPEAQLACDKSQH